MVFLETLRDGAQSAYEQLQYIQCLSVVAPKVSQLFRDRALVLQQDMMAHPNLSHGHRLGTNNQ